MRVGREAIGCLATTRCRRWTDIHVTPNGHPVRLTVDVGVPRKSTDMVAWHDATVMHEGLLMWPRILISDQVIAAEYLNSTAA